MGVWDEKSIVYKVAMVLTYLTFLLYGLSFGNPFWFGKNEAIHGLWTEVHGDDFEIKSSVVSGFGDSYDWLDGVRGCWVAGMFFYVVGIIYSLVENCTSSARKDYGITGMLILLAGLSGAAGVIVTAIKAHDKVLLDHFRWGFIIACIAAGFAIILAIVILISRNATNVDQTKSSRTADYVYAHKHPGPYPADFTNPGYRNDELPLVNGISHSMYRGSNHANGYHPSQRMEPMPTYNPYGYKENRPSNRSSVAESADLSNGFTSEMIHAEQSLARRDDYGRHPAYGRSDVGPKNDYYYGRGY